MTAQVSGKYRIYVVCGVESGNVNQPGIQLYVNDVLKDTKSGTYSYPNETTLAFTDMYITKGETLKIYAKNVQSTFPVNNERSYVKNVYMKYDNLIATSL